MRCQVSLPDTILSVRRLPAALFIAFALLSGSIAFAHATLVFGELTTPETHPDAAEGFTLELHMMDPVRTPIEDAIVAAEFRLLSEEEVAALETDASDSAEAGPTEGVHAEELELPDGDWHAFQMQETGPGGNYAARVQLAEAGVYQLIMRDTTYPQEDAVAELMMRFDGETEFDTALFIFPPTDIGTASLGTWLIWLVAVPVVAGVIVTVAVMARKPADPNSQGSAS